MEMLSILLAISEGVLLVPIDFPHKGPVMHTFGVSFVVGLNKLFNKQSIFRWFGKSFDDIEIY